MKNTNIPTFGQSAPYYGKDIQKDSKYDWFNTLSLKEQKEWWEDYLADQELMKQEIL